MGEVWVRCRGINARKKDSGVLEALQLHAVAADWRTIAGRRCGGERLTFVLFLFLLNSFEIDTHETYDPHKCFVICDDTMHPTLPVE